MSIEVVLYEDKDADELRAMLKEFSQEIYGYGTANLEQFLAQHWVVYLAKKGDEVIGFSSFMYNTYFGLRPPTVGNTYLYVRPAYRRGRASYLLSVQAGYVSIDTDLPLETYYASDDSKVLSKRMKGTRLYEAWSYEPEDMAEAYKNTTRNDKLRKLT